MVSATSGNITNFFVMNSVVNNTFTDLCFYRDTNQTQPPNGGFPSGETTNPNDFVYLLNNLFSYFGIISSGSKMLIATIIILAVIIAISFSIPSISPIIIVVSTFLMIGLFSVLGFIPLWVDILLIAGSIMAIFLFGGKRE